MMWIAGLVASGQTSAGRDATRPDGAYRKEQAKLGQAAYDNKCSECHDGGIMGPELWGSAFSSDWRNKKVRALYDLIAKTMPADNPGTLSETEILNLVAYLLQANGFPPGDGMLDQPAALDAMVFSNDK
jgi:quinoprotein glucose dehydrogenase